MARGKTPSAKIDARATSKVEAVAKIAVLRKKTITEVIPQDVTRAKTKAWLDLISPITQWAGLKGDALRYRRDQLRVQQDETLFRLGQVIQQKIAGQGTPKPVPPKILVPALEKASLEDPNDSVMIERWANLLASASQNVPVQPRFVSILSELTGKQAECLESIAFHNYQASKHPYIDFADSSLDFMEDSVEHRVRKCLDEKLKTPKDIKNTTNYIYKIFDQPGVRLHLLSPQCTSGRFHHVDQYDVVSSTGEIWDDDLAILESLGLIRNERIDINYTSKSIGKIILNIYIYYYRMTDLGVNFVEICAHPTILHLKKLHKPIE